MQTHKICNGCNIKKELNAFAKRNDRPCGVQSKCRTCQSSDRKQLKKKYPERYKAYDRKGHLKETYGISIEEYNQLFHLQNGKCLGCNKHQNEFKRRLDVDHCHEIGKIRGLLCINCNLVI